MSQTPAVQNDQATLDKNKPSDASREIAIERNLTELEVIDYILTSKLSGEVNGYRNLTTDTTVIGTWTQRQSALVQMERQVTPHDPDNPADVEAAEFIKTQIENLTFDQILKAMQWGVYYGYAVAEAMWKVEDGKVGLADIYVRDRGKFKFDKDKRLVFLGNDSEKVMPQNTFWTYSAGGDTTDNPYGLGLAHYLFWAVLFKKTNIKFWLLGLEKAAATVPHVQYDPRVANPEAERQKALQAGISIKNGSAIATAQGTVVELLKGVSGTEDYETLCRYMDEAIALVVLGQVMTSQAVGGQYKAEVQNQVKEDIIKADADLICSSFNNTIVKWLTAWNFPNANPPKLWLLTKDEADELKTTEAWANMVKVGYRPTLETVEETFGGEWEKIPDPASANGDNLPSDPPSNPIDTQTSPNDAPDEFAETDSDGLGNGAASQTHSHAPTQVDGMVEQITEEIATQTTAWIDDIKQRLDKVTSLEQMRGELNKLAQELSFEEYALMFAKANLTAKLAGMASVKDEAKVDEA